MQSRYKFPQHQNPMPSNHSQPPRKNQTPHETTEYDIMKIPIPAASISATHPNYATINPMTPYIRQSN